MANGTPGGTARRAGAGRPETFDPAASAGLFVGVSTFEDERIAAVPFAVDDAVDLAHLFVLELGLIPLERTVLLLAGEPQKPESTKYLAQLAERGACRRTARMPDIYRYLGELARGTEQPGLFVLTVATHGLSDQGGDFLVATDSLRERTLRTGVSVAEMFDEVSRAGAGRRLVLLDACRERLSQGTRGEAEAPMSQSFADAIARTTGLVVLSGATLGGFAYDDVARKNGVFTAAVLDGLHGEAAAGPDDWITVRTLADFVQQRVAAWVRRNRPDHSTQSLGIARRVEATAEFLPLAPHPKATQDRQRYRERREAALARVKENQGKILSGALWDQIATLLPEEAPTPAAERLFEEIEALDGSERGQRSLRDFVREQTTGASPPIVPGSDVKRLEERVAEASPSAAGKPEHGESRRTGGKEPATPGANRAPIAPAAARYQPTPTKQPIIPASPAPVAKSHPPSAKTSRDSRGRKASPASRPLRQNLHQDPAPRLQPQPHRRHGTAVVRSVKRLPFTAIISVIALSVAVAVAVVLLWSLRRPEAPRRVLERPGLSLRTSLEHELPQLPPYDPGNRRDPFKSLLAAADRPEFRGPRPEGIPGLLIDEIQLSNIFRTSKGYVAQVVTVNQKKSFLLKEGDQLYDGDVVSINRNEVVFKQIVQDPTALKPFREVVKSLNPS